MIPRGQRRRRESLRIAMQELTGRAWIRAISPLAGWLFHRDVIIRTRNFMSTSWLGHPIWQNVLDLWTLQEAIAEIRPALLIETGTHRGGAALFYAQLMELLGTGRVITIDIVDKHGDVRHERVTFLEGSSTDPAIVERVRRAAAEATGPVMVILDGDHRCDHVARELELYGPLVTPGSLLLSQDGIIDKAWMFRDSRPGPAEANRSFLARHPEFELDRDLAERFGLTHHSIGWMRRRR